MKEIDIIKHANCAASAIRASVREYGRDSEHVNFAHIIAEEFAHGSDHGPERPSLTHAEAVDFFPILRGRREGFDRDRIDPITFPEACQKHGGGAFKCAKFILSLMGYAPHGFTLDALLSHVDTEHRRAAVALFAAVAERGMK